ncbi:MAG: hypothetical protein J0I43_09755 [Microbacterium sp.]|uniref:hypothetical protein n=1 Tax=Microbacterium sp. TaxID=51671 RepID=UPI001AC10A94|nr:hypothetical protein [Microbacterium sp.]MBN9177636.1 hypothetical protein [Microbacterium sp.]
MVVLTVSFGVTALVVHVLGRLKGKGWWRVIVGTLAAGCGAAAVVMPAGFLGFAISENSRNCSLNSTPLPLVIYFFVGIFLLFVAILWVLVSFMVRAFRSPASL